MTRVVFIGGYSRSGSTLLDRLIGELPGCISTGELGYVTTHGIAGDRLCGCGEPFHACAFWSEVGRVAFGGWAAAEADEFVRLHPTVNRHRYIPMMVFPRLSATYTATLGRYAALLGRLFDAVAEVGGGDVVVDSTVDPSRAFLLRRVPKVDLYPLQIVRDSRGAAYSWTKRQAKKDSTGVAVQIDTFTPRTTATRWTVYHLLFELVQTLIGRRLRIRYEDLVQNPERELHRVGEYLGQAGPTPMPFLDGGSVRFGVHHTTAGNDMRLVQGPVPLRLDEEWRRMLPRRQRWVVTALTWPLLLAYRPGAHAGEPAAQ